MTAQQATAAVADPGCPPLCTHGGKLAIEGCLLRDLAARFGTPLHVVSEARLRANLRAYATAFAAAWPSGEALVLPALKANHALALRRILTDEGAGCDVYSEGELEIALRAGTDPVRISVSGSTKDPALLRRAVSIGARVTADSADELRTVAALAAELGRTALVRLRVRPQLETSLASDFSGRPIRDALDAYKPGLPWEELVPAGRWALAQPQLELAGLTMHIGRHSAELSVWEAAGRAFGTAVVALCDAWDGWTPPTLDVGGGYPAAVDPVGLAGTPGDAPAPARPHLGRYAEAICGGLAEALRAGGIAPESIVLEAEPGRGLYGDCGAHLTRVLHVKRRTEAPPRTWVEVDTTVFFLPDTELEHCRWPLRVVGAEPGGAEELVDVVGRSCTGDGLARGTRLPRLAPGALIAFGATGAYQDAASASFNLLPRPATVLVSGERAELIKRAETLHDLLARDVVPAHLALGPAGVGEDGR